MGLNGNQRGLASRIVLANCIVQQMPKTIDLSEGVRSVLVREDRLQDEKEIRQDAKALDSSVRSGTAQRSFSPMGQLK